MVNNSSSLKDNTVRGILWSAVDKVAVKAIVFVFGIVLARILSPSDFGLVGMLTIFIALSNVIVDSGFSQALVQRHNPTQSDLSTAFYFNIGVGVALYAVLFFIAPFASSFYGEPILTSLLRVLGLSMLVQSLSVVQRARLLIKVDFRTMAQINIIGIVIGGSVGIWTAYNGFGVWALVLQTVILQTTTMGMYWLFGRWRPTAEFSFSSFRSLFKFGSKLLAAGSFSTILTNIYSIVIGKVYFTQELGYYTNARQLSDITSGTINEIINSVTFPILSSIKNDQNRMIAAYGKMLSMTAFFIFPVMTLIAVLAQPFVLGVLTEKWLPTVPLIQWLCMSRIFIPISGLNMNILNAIGRSDLFMKLDFSKVPLIVLVLVITLPISVKAVVVGSFVTNFICYFLNAYLPGKMFGFGIKAQTKIFYKIIIATTIMAGVTSISILFVENPILQLLVGVCVALIVYLSFCKILKVEMLFDLKKILNDLLYRKE